MLINLSSLLGAIPNPIVPTYVMSKFAVRGLTLSLHQSGLGHPSIHACTILPGPIDTPMFTDAANHSDRAIRAIPPAFSPERVAAAVICSVRRPRRQRTTGITGALIVVGLHVAPRLTERIVAQVAARLIFRSERAGGGGGRVRVKIGDAVGRSLPRR